MLVLLTRCAREYSAGTADTLDAVLPLLRVRSLPPLKEQMEACDHSRSHC